MSHIRAGNWSHVKVDEHTIYFPSFEVLVTKLLSIKWKNDVVKKTQDTE